MNLTVSKKDLLRLATRASSIAEKKSTLPSLSLSLIEAREGRLTCSATDLFMSLVDSVAADVTVAGGIAVNPRDLAERSKNLPDGPVTLTLKEGALVLKSGGSARRYTMRGLDGGDYPPLPQPDEAAPTISLPSGVLGGLITHTIFSISTDETRAHLNSALIEMEPGKIRMVSTDGHRLSKCERTIDGGAHATMLVPLKAVHELRRLDEEAGSEPLRLIQSGPNLFVRSGTSTFSVKMVDAQFPPYAQVIPAHSEKVVRVSRAAFAEALKAVAIAASERTGGVRLSLSNGVMRISGEDAAKGEGTDEIPYTLQSGKDGALVGLNARYPLDVLVALSSDEVDVGISAELDPITFRPVGESPNDYVGVLMPMRI